MLEVWVILGRQHLMLSVASVAVLVLPFLTVVDGFVIVMLIGAAIGSLVPDVDAPDAAIFHEDMRGFGKGDIGEMVSDLIGPLLPLFGYGTKFLIYKPAVEVLDFFTQYDFQEKHRSFSHSILGVFTMTALTGIYIIPVLIVLELFAPLYLLAFLFAYMVGAFLHMLEDSCTKTGIKWNSPFSDTKLKGEISTGKDIKKPRYFLYYLGGLSAVAFFLSSSEFTYSPVSIAFVMFVGLAFSWIVFMRAIAEVELQK